jgi:hypothetical protein
MREDKRRWKRELKLGGKLIMAQKGTFMPTNVQGVNESFFGENNYKILFVLFYWWKKARVHLEKRPKQTAELVK